MSVEIPTTEPSELRAGITWQWRREDLSDYPASTWLLTYWCKQQASAGAKFSIVASADGDAHAVEVAATTTGTYTAGDYTWVAVATYGAAVMEVDSGSFVLLPKYNADAALDDRSHAKIMLERVEAALEALALGRKEYTIGSRSYTARDIEELTTLRDKYRGEVHAEALKEAAKNGKAGSQLVFRL